MQITNIGVTEAASKSAALQEPAEIQEVNAPNTIEERIEQNPATESTLQLSQDGLRLASKNQDSQARIANTEQAQQALRNFQAELVKNPKQTLGSQANSLSSAAVSSLIG